MTEKIRPAQLDWSSGAPRAPDFGDVYFSVAGGADETRHVFLEQNHLPERFRQSGPDTAFTIIETGFGTGLNWLATVSLWQASSPDGWLHFVSVEKHPLELPDLERVHACWPQFADISQALRQHYPRLLPGFHRMVFPQWRTTLTLFLGDVDTFMQSLGATADAWFLDGFSPDRNPGMWTELLFTGMARLSKPDATFATFTAAGAVRRSLQAAGFAVEKVPGFGRKREMLRGRFTGAPACSRQPPWLSRPFALTPTKSALIIGAGVAGATTAARLALRGWAVTVIERHHTVAAGGSGNPAAVLYPKLGANDQPGNLFAQQAWLFTLSVLESMPLEPGIWNPCGVLQLLTPLQQRRHGNLQDHPWMPLAVTRLDAATASGLAGVPLHHEAFWYRDAGWLDARRFCARLLDHPNIHVLKGTATSQVMNTDGHWEAIDNTGHVIARSPVAILANGLEAREMPVTGFLPLNPVPGQISSVPASPLSAKLQTVVCHDGYISPPLPDGMHCLGATFHPSTDQFGEKPEDHVRNHAQQQDYLPEVMATLPPPATWGGRASMRCQSPDHLPLAGPLADIHRFRLDYAGLRDGKVIDYPALRVERGLYANLAHGSRGFSQSLLTAEILASEINGEPAPVSIRVLDALHPMRFAAKELKRNVR